jgi:hypothetical protein
MSITRACDGGGDDDDDDDDDDNEGFRPSPIPHEIAAASGDDKSATERTPLADVSWLTCQTEKSERFIEKCDAKRGLTELGGRAGGG